MSTAATHKASKSNISSSNSRGYGSSSSNSAGRWLGMLAIAGLAALLAAGLPTAASAAAAAAAPPAGPATPPASPIAALAAFEGAKSADNGKKRASMNVMDCGQRCESYEIRVFKAHWKRRHPNKHFIDFLRDLVVFSAYYPELRDFKPLVDRAVQNYEMCRYITCSTDYLG